MASWYLKTPHGEHGPLDNAQLIVLIRAGRVGPQSAIRRADKDFFLPAGNIHGLFEQATKAIAESTGESDRPQPDEDSDDRDLDVAAISDGPTRPNDSDVPASAIHPTTTGPVASDAADMVLTFDDDEGVAIDVSPTEAPARPPSTPPLRQTAAPPPSAQASGEAAGKTTLQHPPSPADPVAGRPADQHRWLLLGGIGVGALAIVVLLAWLFQRVTSPPIPATTVAEDTPVLPADASDHARALSMADDADLSTVDGRDVATADAALTSDDGSSAVAENETEEPGAVAASQVTKAPPQPTGPDPFAGFLFVDDPAPVPDEEDEQATAKRRQSFKLAKRYRTIPLQDGVAERLTANDADAARAHRSSYRGRRSSPSTPSYVVVLSHQAVSPLTVTDATLIRQSHGHRRELARYPARLFALQSPEIVAGLQSELAGLQFSDRIPRDVESVYGVAFRVPERSDELVLRWSHGPDRGELIHLDDAHRQRIDRHRPLILSEQTGWQRFGAYNIAEVVALERLLYFQQQRRAREWRAGSRQQAVVMRFARPVAYDPHIQLAASYWMGRCDYKRVSDKVVAVEKEVTFVDPTWALVRPSHVGIESRRHQRIDSWIAVELALLQKDTPLHGLIFESDHRIPAISFGQRHRTEEVWLAEPARIPCESCAPLSERHEFEERLHRTQQKIDVVERAKAERIAAISWKDEWDIELPSRLVEGKPCRDYQCWLLRCIDGSFVPLDCATGRLGRPWRAVVDERLRWAVGGDMAVLWNEEVGSLLCYDVQSGKEQRQIAWSPGGRVAGMGMHPASADRLLAVVDGPDRDHPGWVVDIDLGRGVERYRIAAKIDDGEFYDNFVIAPDAGVAAFRSTGGRSSTIYYYDRGDQRVWKLSESSSPLLGVDGTGLRCLHGRYRPTERSSRLAFCDQGMGRRYPSSHGAFQMAWNELGLCTLYLGGSDEELISFGALPWANGTAVADDSRYKSPYIGMRREREGVSIPVHLDFHNGAIFSEYCGFWAMVDRNDRRRIVCKRFDRSDLIASASEKHLLVTSAAPTVVELGQNYRYQLAIVSTSPFRCVKERGPVDLTVSPDGVVRWLPEDQEDDVGDHPVSIRIVNEQGEASLHEFTLTVPLTVRGAHHILCTLDEDESGRERRHLSFSTDGEAGGQCFRGAGDSVVHAGRRIWFLTRDHRSGRGPFDLQEEYHQVLDCGELLIGIHRNGLDELSPEDGRILHRSSVDNMHLRRGAYDQVNGSVWIPVTHLRDDNQVTRQRIVRYDLKRQRVIEIPTGWASRVAVHPSGKILYGYLSARWSSSRQVVDYFGRYLGRQIVTTSDEMLISYVIDGDRLLPLSSNNQPGRSPEDLAVLPGGQGVLYVARGDYLSGPPEWRGDFIPAFDPIDLMTPRSAYDAGSVARAVVVDPLRHFVITSDGENLRIFDQSTGKPLLDRPVSLGVDNHDFETISMALDSESGTLVVQLGQHETVRSAVRKVHGLALLLFQLDDLIGPDVRSDPLPAVELPTLEELKRSLPEPEPLAQAPGGRGQRPAAPFRRYRSDIREKHFDALRGKQWSKSDPKEIAEDNNDAIVVISVDGGFGTGFIVSRDGLVLTCAHNIPVGRRQVAVTYADQAKDGQPTKAVAPVLAIDYQNDLALVHIRDAPRLPYVRLDLREAPAMGTDVVVIGNPGLGQMMLERSMTTGIVSSPRRVIGGLSFVQTSAAINPGNSGGPIFNDRGNVFGVVTLKAAIEGVAFAVSPDRVRRFLEQVCEPAPGR